jgi:hypothetical protein
MEKRIPEFIELKSAFMDQQITKEKEGGVTSE